MKRGLDRQDEFTRQFETVRRNLLVQIARQRPSTSALTDDECYQQALRRRLDQQPRFVRRLEEIRRDMLAAMIQRELDAQPISIADDELRAYFESHRAEFAAPETLELNWIFIRVRRRATDAEVSAARERAENAWARVSAGESWAGVAAAYSDDRASVRRGGVIRRVKRGVRSAEFDAAAFGLDHLGAISPVFRDRRGFHVVQLVNRAPTQERTFDDARKKVEKALRQQKIDQAHAEYFAKLRAGHQIDIHEDRLDSVAVITRYRRAAVRHKPR